MIWLWTVVEGSVSGEEERLLSTFLDVILDKFFGVFFKDVVDFID
jgi:hypothetical protein